MKKWYKENLNEKKNNHTVSQELLDKNKHRSRTIRAVKKAIQNENLRSVPEIKTLLHFESREIVMAINLLMKYDGLKIVDKSNDYPLYAFGV